MNMAQPTPSHHVKNLSGTSYKNPWPSAEPPTWTDLLSIRSLPVAWPKDSKPSATTPDIKVITPDWGTAALQRKSLDKFNCLIGTWLGHATVLAQLPVQSGHSRPPRTFYCLFDPIFSLRAGPTQYTGPKRFNAPPCQIADLPGCDAVFISHNHYDHLDLSSVTALVKNFPNARYFVPLGNREWLVASGVAAEKVVEMDWWEQREVGADELWVGDSSAETTAPEASKEESEDSKVDSTTTSATTKTTLRITCLPAQHNSGRTGTDSNRSLWCGWGITSLISSSPMPSSSSTSPSITTQPSSPTLKVHYTLYHAGDTGYRRTPTSDPCPIFPEINRVLTSSSPYGNTTVTASSASPSSPSTLLSPSIPVTLSFLPIWRGGSLSFISAWGLRLRHQEVSHLGLGTLHASPADAVGIHLDVKSKVSVAVHFGTFVGSESETREARGEFEAARREGGIEALEGDDEVEKGGDQESSSGKEDKTQDKREDKGRAGVVDIGASVVVEI